MDKSNIFEFLELYESFPCLWNPKDVRYKDNNYRTSALTLIVEKMGLNVGIDQLKTKIKNVRTTYNREFNKVIRSKKSGTGTEDVYKPQLAWFKVADKFLRTVVEGRISKNNMVNGLLFINYTRKC